MILVVRRPHTAIIPSFMVNNENVLHFHDVPTEQTANFQPSLKIVKIRPSIFFEVNTNMQFWLGFYKSLDRRM